MYFRSSLGLLSLVGIAACGGKGSSASTTGSASAPAKAVSSAAVSTTATAAASTAAPPDPPAATAGESKGTFSADADDGASVAAEAKAFVGALFRAAGSKLATAGMLDEGADSAPTGKELLCKPGAPVPNRVPKAETYLASSAPGEDYGAGDDKTGWKCLDFFSDKPQHCQVSYAVGSGYKSVARGGPDPGPDGIEVAAECDADGNGKTSLYARTGTVKEGVLEGSPELFVADDGE